MRNGGGGSSQCAQSHAQNSPSTAAATTSDKKCAATYMREAAMRSGMGRRQSPILGLTKRRTPKKPTVAAVWPLGKELYLELRRGPFQPSSCFD